MSATSCHIMKTIKRKLFLVKLADKRYNYSDDTNQMI